MGNSAEAILFYGFPIQDNSEEEVSNDDLLENWQYKLATIAGVQEPAELYTDSTSPLYRAYFKAKHKVLEAEPCTVGMHGCGDELQSLVAIKASKVSADWGDPQRIKGLEILPQWIDALRAFCGKLGITWQEPGWYIASYYG